MSLRDRLFIILTVGLSASLAVSLLALMRIEKRVLAVDNAERAGAMLATLAAPVALSLVQGRVPDIDNLMTELHHRRDMLRLQEVLLIDQNGRLVARSQGSSTGFVSHTSDPFITKALVASGAMFEMDDQGLPQRLSMPVQTGMRWATLIAYLSTDALQRDLVDRRDRLLVTVTAISLTALLLLLFVLSRFVLRPIDSVAAMAERFAAGDLSARAKVAGGGEISMLARALNVAADRQSKHTVELEWEVKRRTDELQQTNVALTTANERLERLAVTDGLTGLYNHRHFQEMLSEEVKRQKRGKQPFSILMIDVDHFKRFNDTYGHPTGDSVLRAMADLFHDSIRKTDLAARYGGEEFVILLRFAPHQEALDIAENIRAKMEVMDFVPEGSEKNVQLTVSIGVATWPEHATKPLELLEKADGALYQSKGAGRNIVTSANGTDQNGDAL